MDYRLWDSSRSRVPHTTSKLRAKAFLFQFSFSYASHMKTFGAPILQYLFKNLLFLCQENIWHGRTALASIQVDTSPYHFILFTTLYLACCKWDRRKQSVIKFSDLIMYCTYHVKTELYIFIQIQAE